MAGNEVVAIDDVVAISADMVNSSDSRNEGMNLNAEERAAICVSVAEAALMRARLSLPVVANRAKYRAGGGGIFSPPPDCSAASCHNSKAQLRLLC